MFTWELGQGLGHLVRYLPLVRALVGRGDEVWFLVKDAHQAAKVFAGLSINIEQIKPGSPPPNANSRH
jgi:spore coat polysaccharide biosynthesis predicted glycosyltransferase SpsG